MPGSGKSGTSRTKALIASMSMYRPYLRLRLAGGFLLDLGLGRAEPARVTARVAAASVVAATAAAPTAGPGATPPAFLPLAAPPTHGAAFLELTVLRVPALENREDRRCYEDRRVGTSRNADEHREGEVL